MIFAIIPDAVVILRSKGVFKQTKVYERNGYIYAQHGSGFIRLSKDKSTSVSNVRVDEIFLGFEPKYEKFGYMVKPDFPDAK